MLFRSVNTFEPIAKIADSYLVYKEGIPMFRTQTSITNVDIDDNPFPCSNIGEYYAGNECKTSIVLHVNTDPGNTPSTAGVIIPMKNRMAKNTEWTIETWSYVFCGYSKTDIIALGGEETKLGMSMKKGNLFGELVYGTVGTSTEISKFTCGEWNHIELIARLTLQAYEIELGLNAERFNTSVSVIQAERIPFENVYIGMNKLSYSATNRIALKEIRIWDIALPKSTIFYQMRKQIEKKTTESFS